MDKPPNEGDLKMKTTSKWRLPKNEADTKKRVKIKSTSNEDNFK